MLAEREIARSKRYNRLLTIFMLDIDHFKGINDKYGHTAGDEALKKVAKNITASVRECDIVGRYGGEEFVVILPEISSVNAAPIAERIRASVEKDTVNFSENIDIKCTISIGVAEYNSVLQSFEEFVNRADKMLYSAKQNGRNRVEIENSHKKLKI